MTKNGTKGFSRLINATRFTFKGLIAAWKNEEAFRLEVLGLLCILPLAIWLASSYLQFALLLGSGLVVVIVELINSAIEAVVDRIGEERHELSGRAKDMGSAAVFLALILTAIIWIAVVFDRFSG
ncbi:diacylglycerol kinase [Gynuella sunshinyii]|uniref:Diacylglycerol kinase n=1 Tax=Gynuella sunshinyii YC6258 TaxID=1445510 RepID=A0A0C5VTZ8_9GAMM|nr:diacylglycerol kinase [Gynuella sunshinyii]AJQ96743.1 diacylglycerol kinase [Gynuella sunshinyii YC6258]